MIGLKVLYLDFDGVLHPESVVCTRRHGIRLDGHPSRALFENAPYLIEALAPYPDVNIVLSTSWVRARGYQFALQQLPAPLQRRCIGATYHSRWHRPRRDEGFRDVYPVPLRGEEVRADVHRRMPVRWLAFDDTDEGWAPFDEHVLLTDPVEGIGSGVVLELLRVKLLRFQ